MGGRLPERRFRSLSDFGRPVCESACALHIPLILGSWNHDGPANRRLLSSRSQILAPTSNGPTEFWRLTFHAATRPARMRQRTHTLARTTLSLGSANRRDANIACKQTLAYRGLQRCHRRAESHQQRNTHWSSDHCSGVPPSPASADVAHTRCRRRKGALLILCRATQKAPPSALRAASPPTREAKSSSRRTTANNASPAARLNRPSRRRWLWKIEHIPRLTNDAGTAVLEA